MAGAGDPAVATAGTRHRSLRRWPHRRFGRARTRGLEAVLESARAEGARLPAILKHVAADRAYWTLVEVGTDVLAAAEALVAAYPIRTLDAIHVASAQLFDARASTPGLLFVSADKRQTETAVAVGLAARQVV